jgi:hypothetical protein
MKKVLIRNRFFWAIILIAALIGCNKDDVNDGKGVGLLMINGNEYSLATAVTRVGTSSETGPFTIEESFLLFFRTITFYNSESKAIVTIHMKGLESLEFTSKAYTITEDLELLELTSKTYTNNEYEFCLLGLALNDEPFDIDVENFIMVVSHEPGNTFDIKITGKTESKALEYTITYQGRIREENVSW